MIKAPKVSVLIPAYNYGRFLNEAIESVLKQTYPDFEIIIVDNNSTDNTDEVVKPYLSDARIQYHKNPVNIGMVPNFNKCMDLAKGDYIKFLLADDLFHPELLSKFVAILDQYPNVTIVTSQSESFGLESELRVSPFEHLQSGEKIIKESIRNGKGNFIGEPTTVMFRRSNLHLGKFEAEYLSLNDLNLWLRHLTVGDCYFIPEVLSYFRIHEQQATIVNNYANWFDEYNFFKKVKTENVYKIDYAGLNLDKTIKKTALKSAGAMYKLLPELKNKKYRKLFTKALKISLKEGVFLSSLVVHFSRKKKQFANPVSA